MALKCLHKLLQPSPKGYAAYQIETKAVLFECTGSLAFWKILNETLKISDLNTGLVGLNNCDVIVYLTEPNLFNTLDEHIGDKFVIKNDFGDNLKFLGELSDFNPDCLKIKQLYKNYKTQLEKLYFSYQSKYADILKSNKKSAEEFEKALVDNYNKAQDKMNDIHESKRFFISGIQALTDKRLNEIENHFNPSTQKLDCVRKIEIWPTQSNYCQSKGEVKYYHDTLDIIYEQINDIERNSNLRKLYQDEAISYFECIIDKTKHDSNLFKLAIYREQDIISTFTFIRKQLIYLKSLIKIEKLHEYLSITKTYKIKSRSKRHTIQTIKNALQRLAYIDKQMQLKLNILKKEENYRLFNVTKVLTEDEQLSDFIYGWNNVGKIRNSSFLEALETAEHKLKNLMKELDSKYEDKEFDAIDKSLFNDLNYKYNFQYYNEGKKNEIKIEIKWERPNLFNLLEQKEISNHLNTDQNNACRAIFRNIYIDNVSQGKLSDCWLVASMAAISLHSVFLNKIFMASLSVSQLKCSKYGCYALNLCINGIWEAIIIDDKLPCRADGRPKFAQTYKYQIWGNLIEKALAKRNKTYENLEFGTLKEGFSLLTGYASESFPLSSTNQIEVWANILKSNQKNSLMGCSCLQDENKTQNYYLEKNLVLNHDYTIIKAIELEEPPVKLLLLRNALNSKTWNGRWSGQETSNPCWTNDLRIKIRKDFDLPIDELHAFGIFWIQLEDFVECFSDVTICNIYEQQNEKRINGVPILNNDGSINMYELEILKDGSLVYIELFDHQSIRKSLSNADLGLVILDDKDKIVTYSLKGYTFNVTERLELNKGNYKILPLSFRYLNDLSQQRKFNLVIHCNNNEFSVEKDKSRYIEYFWQTILKIVLDLSKSNRKKHRYPNQPENLKIYSILEKSYHFFFAYNNTNSQISVETKIEPGSIQFVPGYHIKTNTPHTEVNDHFRVIIPTDRIPPNTKSLILILSDYTSLIKKSGYRMGYIIRPRVKFNFKI